MGVETFVAAADLVVILAVFCGLWLARRGYFEEQKRVLEKLAFLEACRADHEKWATARSQYLDSTRLITDRLDTLMQVMDKRVTRLEDYEMGRHQAKEGFK